MDSRKWLKFGFMAFVFGAALIGVGVAGGLAVDLLSFGATMGAGFALGASLGLLLSVPCFIVGTAALITAGICFIFERKERRKASKLATRYHRDPVASQREETEEDLAQQNHAQKQSGDDLLLEESAVLGQHAPTKGNFFTRALTHLGFTGGKKQASQERESSKEVRESFSVSFNS